MYAIMTTPEKRPEQGVYGVPLKWENAGNLPMLFTNHLFVRRQDDYVIITFGQAELPYEIQISTESLKQLEEDGLQIQVVARLATTRQVLNNFIRHLSTIRDSWPETADEPETS